MKIFLTILCSLYSIFVYSNPKVRFVETINNFSEFEKLALPSGGIIRQGKTVKFLIDKRDIDSPKTYFINANYCPKSSCSRPLTEATFHYDFAKKVINNFEYAGSKNLFNQNFYYTSSLDERRYLGGRIQEVQIKENGQTKRILGVRFIERDLINEEMITYAMSILNSNIYSDQNTEIAFVINSQNHKVTRVRDWFSKNNVGLYSIEELVSNIPYFALNPGIAYGILNFFPAEPDDLEPYEIAFFDEVPLDLAVVAATITRSFQDVGSHVNLKSKERNTPNMVLRDALKVEELRKLDGRPIKLTVTFEGFQVEELESADIVFEEYKKKVNRPWQKPSYSDSDKITFFEDMCKRRSTKRCLERAALYGGKAASLGFLAHKRVTGLGSRIQKKLGHKLTPTGFGVSLASYQKFIDHNNKGLFKEKLALLINSEMEQNNLKPLPSKEKRALVKEVRALFLNAEIPASTLADINENIEELKEKITKQYGVDLKKIKIRSSANTEDIDGFNGAGLHDSFSAKIDQISDNAKECTIIEKLDEETGLVEEKIKPKTVACAIKAVYASLWSLRAVRERSYRRFDHRYAQMGLAIHPTYKFRPDSKIAANSVYITRAVGTKNVYGHQVSTQLGNGLVTNPTPNTRSELLHLTFASGGSFGINPIQYAKPFAEQASLTQLVLPQERVKQMASIARIVEIKYCEARKSSYFPSGKCSYVNTSVRKKLSLDMEFKHFANGESLIKQVRTFSGK